MNYLFRGFTLLLLFLAYAGNAHNSSTPNNLNNLIAEGGTLTTTAGETEIFNCAGDGISDSFDVILTGATGEAMVWVITDTLGVIISTPPTSPFDFETSGDVVYLLRNLSYDGGIDFLAVGNNISQLVGDFDFSNPIRINNTGVNGGNLLTLDGGFSLITCSGDGVSDAFDVSLLGNIGPNSGWLITTVEDTIQELSAGPPFDFEGTGSGVLKIFHISYADGLMGMAVGQPLSGLSGCFDLSSSILVNRKGINGGDLSTSDGLTEFSMCSGDGVPDPFQIILENNEGTYPNWVVTDGSGMIESIPTGPPFDLEGTGGGVSQLWFLSSNDEMLTNFIVGNQIGDVQGCFDLSNPITINKSAVAGGMLQTLDGSTEISICVGDGVSDSFDVDLTGNSGTNSTYVITNSDSTILEIVATPPFDLEGAGEGTCLIWHIGYDDVTGLVVDNHINDLNGCMGISNPIVVIRNTIVPGNIVITGGGTSTTICAGDGNPDPIDVDLTGNSSELETWLITDLPGNILDIAAGPPFDLEGAGEGECVIWHLGYTAATQGIVIGNNANTDIIGCHKLSNPITVVRNGVDGGTINSNGQIELTTCAGDGMDDFIDVDLSGNMGTNTAWVITDQDLNILDLPMAPPFNLEGAGVGVCLIWNLSYDDGLTGLTVGQSVLDLNGCFALSNSIQVNRTASIGGALALTTGGNVIDICAGDGISDAFEVDLIGNSGQFSGWIITTQSGEILDLPAGPPFDLEGADTGICLIWHISYSDLTSGLEIGNNAMTDIQGCYDLSNPITVTRTGVAGGNLSITNAGTDTTVCVGDGTPDGFPVSLSGDQGTNSMFLITDADLNILDTPLGPPFDLEGAGPGVCQIWHLSYEDGLTGAEVGMNAGNLVGCFAFSNPITVTRISVDGGSITLEDGTSTIDICSGDGVSDALNVNISDDSGELSTWLVTDDLGEILMEAAGPPFDLEGAPAGTCQIWHLSYSTGTTGIEVGNNINSDLAGCFDLSNAITVNRTFVTGAVIDNGLGGDTFTTCLTDGIVDTLFAAVSGGTGDNTAWVITDADLNIVDLTMAPIFIFEDAGAGICQVWHVSYNGELENAEMGNNVSEINGCYALSNPITVTRNAPVGGSLSTLDGETEITICVGDDVIDSIDIISTDQVGMEISYMITDETGEILGAPAAPPFVLEGAGEGACFIWLISHDGPLEGLEVGENAANLMGCYSGSNFIKVNRVVEGDLCITSVQELDELVNISVMPNPATEIVNVNYTGNSTGTFNVALLNVLGEVILNNQEVRLQDGLSMNVATLPRGVYYLEFKQGGQRGVRPVVLQ